MKKLNHNGCYIKCKIFNRSIVIAALVDSGNVTNESLISENLCNLLNLKVEPESQTLGTAGSNTVKTIGRCQPFTIILEGSSTPMEIRPLVVQHLSHHLNLGTSFLAENKAELKFSKNHHPLLKIKGRKFKLQLGNEVMSTPSKDQRFSRIIKQFLAENPHCNVTKRTMIDLNIPADKEPLNLPGVHMTDSRTQNGIIFNKEKLNAYSTSKIRLKPNTVTVLKCRAGRNNWNLKNKTILFMPLTTNNNLTKKRILPLGGILTTNINSTFQINVLNLAMTEVIIDENAKLGEICLQSDDDKNQSFVNTLGHQDENKLTSEEVEERRQYIIESLKIKDKGLIKDRPDIQEQIVNIFLRNFDAVSLGANDIGSTDLIDCQLHLKPGSVPHKSRIIPLSPPMEEILRKQIDGWIQNGTIEPAFTEYSSPIFPVAKKTAPGEPPQWRFVVNFKQLNEKLVNVSYPIPSIEASLQKLGRSTVFSCLDSVSAFSAIKMHPDSRDLTTFACTLGTFRYRRMPFGLSAAPSVYQRLVQRALQMLPQSWLYTMAYLDDLVVFSRSLEDHLRHLDLIISLQKQIGLKLNLTKCHVFEEKVIYLGHEISKEGIGMVQEYIQKILDWKLPETSKQLASFLGFTGYYQRSIPDYGKLTALLNDMKTQESPLKWSNEAKECFEKLKLEFSKKPLRAFPQFDSAEPFILDVDFSAINLAAILSQKQDGIERIIGCVAKKCSKPESSYSSFKGELAAILLGVRKFEHLLRLKKFLIRSDSKSLVSLKNMKDPRGIFVRWQSYLDSFNYDLEHRSGKRNANADGLSRAVGLKTEGPANFDPYQLDEELVDEVYQVEEQGDYIQSLKKDDVLQQIMQIIKNNEVVTKEKKKEMNLRGRTYLKFLKYLKIKDDKLYLQLEGWKEPKLCPPINMYDQIFKLCHENKLLGHGGMNETIHQINQRFYFPHIPTYVSGRIRNCVSCLKKQLSVDKIKHQMSTQKLGFFNELLFSDTVGPLTTVKYNGKRCKHVLTLLDGYSRYLVAVPIENLETTTIARSIIYNWILKFGLPLQLHTDNGTSYTSELFQTIFKELGIKRTMTPIYTPQSNRVERHHRSLFETIRTNDEILEGQWPQKLVVATFAHNIKRNRTTGFSPFFMLHGFNPILPVDHIYPELRPKDSALERLFEGFETLYRIVSKNQQKYQALLRLNKGIPDLQEQDICYYFYNRIMDPKLSKKLQGRYIGPFRITKKLSDHLFIIYPEGNWSKNPKPITAIANRLRKIQPQKEVPESFDLKQIDENEAIESEIIIGRDLLDDDKTKKTKVSTKEKDMQDLEATEKQIEEEIFGNDEPGKTESNDSLSENIKDMENPILRPRPYNNEAGQSEEIPTRMITRSMARENLDQI